MDGSNNADDHISNSEKSYFLPCMSISERFDVIIPTRNLFMYSYMFYRLIWQKKNNESGL